MSLFKAREWWSTTVGEEEEFDFGCLCIANIDNNSDGLDKIIVGSFHGVLRIYNPHPVKGENGWSGFKADDVMCETSLNQPILQVEAGRFLSGSDQLNLAVLHPRKITIYSVAAVSGMAEHGNYCQLKLLYEHNLKRTAFNFCYGPFGGTKGRDFLCVQSMDCTVSVFEQESFAFSRFLPGALLPGPIKYVSRTDSFVTVSANRQVESYKYQVLAVATDAKTKEESQSLKSGKRVAHDWTFSTGEQALDIAVVGFEQAPPSILVLGERNMFCLTDGGKLRFMKKFEFSPSCFLPYGAFTEGNIHTVVGTHTSTVMVHQDITLKWAAQVPHVPVQVAVANFSDLKGVIVTLSENGQLQCSYLGTDPAMFATPTAQAREIDYVEQDRELKSLQKVIKEQSHKAEDIIKGKDDVVLPTISSDDDIQISLHVPHCLDDVSQAVGTEVSDEDPIPSITVKIQLKARVHVSNVKLTIDVPQPLIASETAYSFASIDSSRPVEANVSFFLKYNFLPADLSAEATATYQNSSGAPRVSQIRIKLPLKIAIKPVLPVKNAIFKVTVDTNKPPVNLNDIFPDLLGENAGGQGNALGFGYYGGPVVTMLASKTSQRYRLQCDAFEAIWLIFNELVNRLNGYFSARKQTDFRVSFEGQLPLQEYYDVIDKHFECRRDDEKYKELLAERASQFRAIQRRLLTRFKDKTPAPLSNLDTLLDGTYRQLLALADAMEENRRIREAAGNSLSCATRLLNLMIKLWSGMSDKEFHVLESALTPAICDNGEQGWEEMVDAAITHLLRTCLAKSAKDQTVNPSPLTVPKDTTKIKKHIALLCDRISKGAKLVIDNSPESGAGQKSTRPEPSERRQAVPSKRFEAEEDTESGSDLGNAEVPLGSKFGEKKSPRRDQGLPSLKGQGGGLPPLGGGGRGLAPLGENNLGAGLNLMKKKQPEPAAAEVPDLDDMGTTGSDGSLVNGSNELVYGL